MSDSTINAPECRRDEEISYSDQLIFWLNGSRVQINNPDPSLMLTEYLRKAGYTGTYDYTRSTRRAISAKPSQRSTR